MNKQQVIKLFLQQFKLSKDVISNREQWNCFVDSLIKSNEVNEKRAYKWSYPRLRAFYNPRSKVYCN